MRPAWFLTLALAPLGYLLAAPPPPHVTDFAPLDYFDAHCARCHGPNGSFYGAGFAKNLKDDAALREVVKAMCEGPGGAPLDDTNLEVETDFHRALRDGKPYVVVVSFKDNTLSGEASPDAKLTLDNGTKSTEITLTGHSWSVALAPDFDFSQAQIRAVRGDGTGATLKFGN